MPRVECRCSPIRTGTGACPYDERRIAVMIE